MGRGSSTNTFQCLVKLPESFALSFRSSHESPKTEVMPGLRGELAPSCLPLGGEKVWGKNTSSVQKRIPEENACAHTRSSWRISLLPAALRFLPRSYISFPYLAVQAAVADACSVAGESSELSCRELFREGLTTGKQGPRHCRPGSALRVLMQAVKY